MKDVCFILKQNTDREVLTLSHDDETWQCWLQMDPEIDIAPLDPQATQGGGDDDEVCGSNPISAIPHLAVSDMDEHPDLMLALSRNGLPDKPPGLPIRLGPAAPALVPIGQDSGLITPVYAGPPLRRRLQWPSLILVVVLFIFAADIALLLYSQWQTNQSIAALRVDMTDGGPDRIDELLKQIRREVRTHNETEAIQVRHEIGAFIESETARQSERLLAELKVRAPEATPPGKSDQLLEQILAELRARPMQQGVAAGQSPPQGHLQPASSAALPAAHSLTGDLADASSPDPAADRRLIDTIFFIDASENLAESMPLFLDELRRAIDHTAADERWSVLVYHDEQLIEIPQDEITSLASLVSSAGISQVSAPVQLFDAVGEALAEAIRRRPAQLFIFATNLGNVRQSEAYSERLLRSLRQSNPGGTTRIHTMQFAARDDHDLLLQIARENSGTFTLISPATR